ncbi:uncharacterized protein PHALS_14821 [Plasmopara halstedii]|uniref:Uncharacterized protein n=1 Tax=Plasmopara halstedii TaxID=4781 RepID=A0A0N7L3H2_PLAHL|nr:uncharacterized protein PHALS_14821 [Plasmopara halstedii]CEG35867.1 hypothetical protein PHALS_14821 [Plasmopara halstedii]|eukprot:XP_024572236.1 hypothetical protein PHALS_14821 [Plasmopara halstedii]
MGNYTSAYHNVYNNRPFTLLSTKLATVKCVHRTYISVKASVKVGRITFDLSQPLSLKLLSAKVTRLQKGAATASLLRIHAIETSIQQDCQFLPYNV